MSETSQLQSFLPSGERKWSRRGCDPCDASKNADRGPNQDLIDVLLTKGFTVDEDLNAAPLLGD